MRKSAFTMMLAVAAVMAFAVTLMAAALTAGRDTPSRTGDFVALTQGSNTVYAGAMVAVDTNGLAVAASDTAGLAVVGCAEITQDNTGANYSAARVISVRRGIFRWDNGGAFTDADIGAKAYVQDDATVTTAAAASSDVAAGIIVDVDDEGVWVDSRTAPLL